MSIFSYFSCNFIYICTITKISNSSKIEPQYCYKIYLIYITWNIINFSMTYLFLPIYPGFRLRYCFKINLIFITWNNIFFLSYLEEEQSFFAKLRNLFVLSFFVRVSFSFPLKHDGGQILEWQSWWREKS